MQRIDGISAGRASAALPGGHEEIRTDGRSDHPREERVEAVGRVEPQLGQARERARRHSIHSVTISATGWMLTWRVTPSLAPLKL